MKIIINPLKEDFEYTLNESVNYLKNNKNILTIILFGSYARGDYSLKHSDIDLYILMKNKKDSNLEKTFWRFVNNIHKNIQVHLNFEYNNLSKEGSLLRYNIFKEGKILYEKNKYILLKKDFDLEEVYLIKLNLSKLQANQKYSFKRTMTLKYKKLVLYYDARTIIIKKEFLTNFDILTKKKKIIYEIIYEYLFREKKEYDEE